MNIPSRGLLALFLDNFSTGYVELDVLIYVSIAIPSVIILVCVVATLPLVIVAGITHGISTIVNYVRGER